MFQESAWIATFAISSSANRLESGRLTSNSLTIAFTPRTRAAARSAAIFSAWLARWPESVTTKAQLHPARNQVPFRCPDEVAPWILVLLHWSHRSPFSGGSPCNPALCGPNRTGLNAAILVPSAMNLQRITRARITRDACVRSGLAFGYSGDSLDLLVHIL